jgi:hypothetical protein
LSKNICPKISAKVSEVSDTQKNSYSYNPRTVYQKRGKKEKNEEFEERTQELVSARRTKSNDEQQQKSSSYLSQPDVSLVDASRPQLTDDLLV